MLKKALAIILAINMCLAVCTACQSGGTGATGGTGVAGGTGTADGTGVAGGTGATGEEGKTGSAGTPGAAGNSGGAGSTGDADNPEKISITVGGWPAMDEALNVILPLFNEKYPDIEVIVPESMPKAGDWHPQLQAMLISGHGAPDVCLIEEARVGVFKDHGLLVNLYDEPYNARKYRDDFVDYKWNSAVSADGKALAGLIWDIGPCTFFYNASIFEAAGLPVQPADVEEYLSTWEGFFDACEKVHALSDDTWLIGSAADVFQWLWLGRDYYLFDPNSGPILNFEQKPRFDEFLENSMKIRDMGWDANTRLWIDDESYTYYDTAQIAGIASGAWMGGFFKSWMAVNQAGNFRVCRLPLGLPSTNSGGSYMCIPEQSRNKEAAWKFIEFVLATAEAQNKMFEAVDYFPAYKPAWNDRIYEEGDPFFGGQKTRELWAQIAAEVTPPPFPTPMDSSVEWDIVTFFNDGMRLGLSKDKLRDFIRENCLINAKDDTESYIAVLREAGILH
ncbi:MAG: extracellular solute-binding protein [Peptococcaceae bacterium]|nr:extracellular solute-binding protein [Peptococcaceae bacterium]